MMTSNRLFFVIGNQYISELTYAGYTVLKINLMSFSGEFREIEYNFHVENKTNKYKLHVSESSSSGIGKKLLDT